MQQDFRVGAGAEAMSPGFEPPAGCLKIIQLAVEHQPDGFVFIGHGLAAGRREVNDGQTAEPQPDAVPVVGIKAVVIRPPMPQAVRLALQPLPVHRLPVLVVIDPAEATHGDFYYCPCSFQSSAWERKISPKLCLDASGYCTQPIEIRKILCQAGAWRPRWFPSRAWEPGFNPFGGNNGGPAHRGPPDTRHKSPRSVRA